MPTLRAQIIRLANQNEGLRPHLLPLLREAADVSASIPKVALSQVSKIILEQMGGARKIAMMLGIGSGPGYIFYDLPGNKGVGFSWPNRQRSKGNNVEIMLMPDDTYKMTFFNVSGADKKLVKKLDGIYADQLVELFEGQTGWYLRL